MDGDKIDLILRRLKCKSCRKISVELPDYIIPYKRYSLEVIINICVADDSCIVPEDNSTRQKIKKWYKAVVSHLIAVWQRLAKRDLLSPSIKPTLKNMVTAAVNSGMWAYHPNGNFVQ